MATTAVRVLIALVIGVAAVALMALAASAAFEHGAPGTSRALFWQNTMLQSFFPPHNIGTPERPFYEATPLNILAYYASYPVGALAYGGVAYFLLSRRKNRP